MKVTEKDLARYVEDKVKLKILEENLRDQRKRILDAYAAGALPETERFLVQVSPYNRCTVHWGKKFIEYVGQEVYNRIERHRANRMTGQQLSVVRVK